MRFLIFLLLCGLLMSAQTIDRSKPPQTPPVPGYKLPPLQESALSNGLRVVLVVDQRFPLVTLRMSFQAGSKYDPKDLPGLAEGVAALLTEGTKTRSSREIAEELASFGGNLNGVSGPDGLTLVGSALSENLPRLLDILSDVALNASFPENEIQLRRQNRKQALLAERSEPSFLANEKFSEVLFGTSGYAHIAPTVASLDRMDRKALMTYRDTYLVPNNATLILLGRIPGREGTLKLIEERFGTWKKKAVPAAPKADFPSPKQQIVLVDRPNSVQADVHIGKLGLARANPEYFPMAVASNILGGGASSRLFQDIREKQGFAYDVHTELVPKKDAGSMAVVTQVRNEVLEPAMRSLLDHMQAMTKERVTSTELSDTKNYMSGMYLLRLETQSGLAEQLNMIKVTGLPNEYLETYTLKVRAVEPDQIQAAALKYLDPSNAAVVVVGDASKIEKTLEKFGTVKVVKEE